MKYLALATLFVACTSLSCLAQTSPKLRDVNAHSWWVYYGEHPVMSSRWALLSEVQARRSNFASSWQQLLIRDGLLYNFSPNVQVGGGYGFIKTSRYGDYPAPKAFQEHRIFAQLVLKHQARQVVFEHRYRVEKRWLEAFAGTNAFWRPQNRFRYQLRGAVPFSKLDARGRQWYLFAGDEIKLGFGANHGASVFDQNRAFAGIGYRVTRNNRLEVGYLHQFVAQRNGIVEESNHTLRVQWTSFAPLFQKR
jgi:hypothetical protein